MVRGEVLLLGLRLGLYLSGGRLGVWLHERRVLLKALHLLWFLLLGVQGTQTFHWLLYWQLGNGGTRLAAVALLRLSRH